jgi:hypothetical protein
MYNFCFSLFIIAKTESFPWLYMRELSKYPELSASGSMYVLADGSWRAAARGEELSCFGTVYE